MGMEPPNSNEPISINEGGLPPSSANQTNQQNTTESLASQAQSLTSRALQFLSEASNETLGACLVGLGATTYLVLGRVGLVLIGVVSGVALHAHWENKAEDGGDEESRAKELRRRRDVGLDVAQRVLDWRRQSVLSRSHDGLETTVASGSKSLSGKALDYSGFKPGTAAALNDLTDAIIQDYVK